MHLIENSRIAEGGENMILRKSIYLVILSSEGFEDCAQKLQRMRLNPGEETKLCNIILDCCCGQRKYEKFFQLLVKRLCEITVNYKHIYEKLFKNTYDVIYNLEPSQLRNLVNFYAYLFTTDSISWKALSCVKLNENDTDRLKRIFLTSLFHKLSKDLSVTKLNKKLQDPAFKEYFTDLFPKDNLINTKFAINFFRTIGLRELAEDLCEYLESMTK